MTVREKEREAGSVYWIFVSREPGTIPVSRKGSRFNNRTGISTSSERLRLSKAVESFPAHPSFGEVQFQVFDKFFLDLKPYLDVETFSFSNSEHVMSFSNLTETNGAGRRDLQFGRVGH